MEEFTEITNLLKDLHDSPAKQTLKKIKMVEEQSAQLRELCDIEVSLFRFRQLRQFSVQSRREWGHKCAIIHSKQIGRKRMNLLRFLKIMKVKWLKAKNDKVKCSLP